MPLIAPSETVTLSVPPGFDVVALHDGGDSFGHACRHAGDDGAGTLVWSRRVDLAEFALVLEPTEPLLQARKALFLAMNAIADAIAAHSPPERAVAFDWPDAIRFDGGLIGGARIGWPQGCREADIPDWLVLGGIIRLSFSGGAEPGQAPDATALDEEGFEGQGPATVIESFARFFLRQVDLWQSKGFAPIAADYLARLARVQPEARRGLDGNGDLLTHAQATGTVIRSDFGAGLAESSWLDRETGAPRL
jgi:biotin-(acetyl-CoA carboxylase) ligase